LITALVINFNQRELLTRCISSLLEADLDLHQRLQVIVVDNASDDDSVAHIQNQFPEIEVVAETVNFGFARAIQRNMPRVHGEWLLLLNNDATVTKGALRELISVAETNDSTLGAVAAQMRFAEAPDIIDAAGIEVDRLGVGMSRHTGTHYLDAEQEPTEIFGASGGASLFRVKMLEELGGFDERFFMYYEDADLAWRAQVAGWRTLTAPRAVVLHHHAASSGHASDFQLYNVGANRIRTLAKNAPTAHLLRYGIAIICYDVCYSSYLLVTRHTLAPLRGRIHGLRRWRTSRDRRHRDATALIQFAGLRASMRRHRAANRYTATG
jgi:GT2 family glycosyltransferase